MRIGELSRRTGISVRMLRYYEAEGLLRPSRTEAGHRLFDPAALEAVRRIRLLGKAGMTLDTIRQLLPCVTSSHPTFQPCERLRRVLSEQVERLDRRIGDLAESRTILAGFLATADDPRSPRPTRARARS